jgi:hypothetical protein
LVPPEVTNKTGWKYEELLVDYKWTAEKGNNQATLLVQFQAISSVSRKGSLQDIGKFAERIQEIESNTNRIEKLPIST